MKLLSYILLIAASVLIVSCSGGDKSAASTTPAATQAPAAVAAASTGAIEHYTCPNGHAGFGGASAGTCTQCGATLDHNAAFHDTPSPNDQTAAPDPVTNQNINSGVEHYICPNGHIGSGGPSAGACSNCGATLEHNTAYHNTPQPTDLTNEVNNIEPSATPSEPTVVSTSGVEHYICPNGHVGSGGPGEGVCSQCSATLLHNDAFHANNVVNTTNTNPTAASPSQVITPQPMEAVPEIFRNNPVNVGGSGAPSLGGGGAEPAQNSRGVWHYVCSNGCGGGAGSAVACSVCGNTLAHNDLYHN